MKISIRKSKKGDLSAIQDINYKSWLETYPNKEHGITLDDVEDRFKTLKETWKKRGAGQTTKKGKVERIAYVATVNNKVVGYAVGIIKEKTNQLQAIYILSKYQKHGIGEKLFNKLIDAFFDKNKDIIVEVATYNTQAINAYKKWGFTDSGKRFHDERFRFKSGSIIPEMVLTRSM